MPKIDWNKVQESNILILKENEPIRVKFIDNGISAMETIIDKRTEKEKEVEKFVFEVQDLNDDNVEKEFSTLATRLKVLLKQYIPLKDKSLNINKFRTGADDFDIDFKVSLIE